MEELKMTFVCDHHGFGVELIHVVHITTMVELVLALAFRIVRAGVGLFILRAALGWAWSHDGDGGWSLSSWMGRRTVKISLRLVHIPLGNVGVCFWNGEGGQG
jgi:hypothetical protein